MKFKPQTPYEFFYENAGYCYAPAKETREEGRARCAMALVEAEKRAYEAGYSFRWTIDPSCTSEDFRDDVEPYEQWQCVAYNEDGEVVGSLGGIDFGPGVEPWGQPYCRVVEAELALLESFGE